MGLICCGIGFVRFVIDLTPTMRPNSCSKRFQYQAWAALVCLGLGWPAARAAHVGTPVDYAVTESGAAALSIAIQIPRGIGGMEPQLSLAYSSTAGNGLLGLGWVLTGPSTISRCPQDMINDGVRGSVNFDANDRFCLDGQRLLQVGAGAYGGDQVTYRTQHDSFQRITSLGNFVGADGAVQVGVPNSFKVETKSGLILEFGIGANSQVPTNFPYPATKQTVNRWMLQRVSDRTPNHSFIEFVYCGGSVSADGTTCTPGFIGSTVLHYIRYTNRNATLNGENAVVFHYTNRPDATIGYHAGSASTQAQRISSIETYREFAGPGATLRGKIVKGYDIAYEATEDSSHQSIRATGTSRIASITERDAAGNTLPPLTFSIATDAVFGMSAIQPTSTVTTSTGIPKAPEKCGGVIGTRVSMLCP